MERSVWKAAVGRVAAAVLAAVVAGCGDGSRPANAPSDPIDPVDPTILPEVGAPAPSDARPYFFHSLFEYTSTSDLDAFVAEVTSLPAGQLPMRIGWRTQATQFPGVDASAQAAAMAQIDDHYASEGVAAPAYSYVLYEAKVQTAAEISSGFSALASAVAAQGVTLDEILLERPIGGSSMALVSQLKTDLPKVSIAVSTTHLALESGCNATAAAWDRFYLQMYSIEGVDVCLEDGCTSAYCGTGAPTAVAQAMAALATSPCRDDPDAFVFVSSYEEATDTDCSGKCTETCRPGLMGGTSTVFTAGRWSAYAAAFSATASGSLSFTPNLGVYVPRNAMRAWSTSTASAYTPYKPNGKECACL